MEKAISIKMFPAEEGDSILINCYEKECTKILIDCGKFATYNSYLKDYLMKLPKLQRKLDLIIFTHLHEDHIQGGIALFRDPNMFKEIEVKEVWLNGFKHIPFTNISEDRVLNPADKKSLNEILFNYRSGLFEGVDKQISANQNMDLEDLIPEIIWNKSFKNFQNGKITVENKSLVQFTEEIVFRILSPREKDLEKLEDVFLTELRKKYKSALNKDRVISKLFERIIAQSYLENYEGLYKSINFTNINLEQYLTDDLACSEPDYVNKSSIAFVLEFNESKCLFMGDCYSSQIVEDLKTLYKTENGKIYFDAIKVAHHGSKFNIHKEFLEYVDAEYYFISTDGSKHGHPNIETLARIVCRPSEVMRKLIFNYKTEISQKMSEERLCKKYNYSVEVTNEEKFVLIGEE